MYLSRVLNRVRPTRQTRLISNYQTLRDSKATDKPTTVGESTINAEPTPNVEAASKDPTINIAHQWIEPTKFNKRVLVWMKYYKNIDEVPTRVKYGTMDKAQNKFRIRCCNLMILTTLLSLFISVQLGKRRAEQGETLETMNTDWHGKIRKE